MSIAVESLPSRSRVESETLMKLSPMLSLSCFSSRRRSHLDSASYRTLVRLYSLSLSFDDDDEAEQQQVGNAPSPSLDHDSNQKTGALPPKPKSEIKENSQMGEEFFNSKLQTSLDNDDDEDDCINMGLLEDMIRDCAKLIGGKQDEDVNPNLVSLDNGVEAKNQEKDITSESTELDKENREEAREDEMHEFNGQTEENVPCEKATVKGIEEGTHQDDRPTGDEEMEEGEISDDFDNSREGSVHEGFDKNGNRDFSIGTSSIKLINEHASSTLISEGTQSFRAFDDVRCVESQTKNYCIDEVKENYYTNLENSAAKEKEKPVDTEGLEVRVRKKRGPLTEERKAKKKIAKKRKRAKKEREQGVKRLKIQPITKPKEIKYCNFYMMGRCQQGDRCKFSHDTTPLTKSQPCKYFACDSCLKGDDCPFDHQLSKYPCHNYVSKGTCIRGDRCKFSHKLSTAESSPPTSIVSKVDPLLSSGNSNLVYQLRMNRTSTNIKGQPKTTSSSSQVMMHKPLAGNIANDKKKPAQNIPKGIRFFSFGSGPSDKDDEEKTNQQKSIPVPQSTQNQLSIELRNCAGTSSHASKEKNASMVVRGPARDTSRSLQTEVTEASKILEEFLFC